MRGASREFAVFKIKPSIRWYTPPTKTNWSKQNDRIRTKRPLTDPFDLTKLHPEKEWWKEKKLRPETFMGLPSVIHSDLRGGSIFAEQMDPITLSVVCDRMVHQGERSHNIWSSLCRRAQQIANKTYEPNLCYVFRSHSQINWYDHHFFATYLGRIDQRLYSFSVLDCAIVLEGMANPKFRNERALERIVNHANLLITHLHGIPPLQVCQFALSVNKVLEDKTDLLRSIADWLMISNVSTIPVDIARKTYEVLIQFPDICNKLEIECQLTNEMTVTDNTEE